MNDSTDWRIEELSEAEIADLEATKATLPSCQDDVPEGETGFGGPEGEDDNAPGVLIEEGTEEAE